MFFPYSRLHLKVPLLLQSAIRDNGLDRYLDFWLDGTDHIPNKMDHKRPIMERYEIGEDDFRKTAVLIGDGYKDMDIAKNWGIRGVFVVSPHNDEQRARNLGKADAIVHSLTELPEALPLLDF